jgi:exonuclease III
MRYDYILASPGLMEKCIDATHIQDNDFLKLSDHFPVIAEFAR